MWSAAQAFVGKRVIARLRARLQGLIKRSSTNGMSSPGNSNHGGAKGLGGAREVQITKREWDEAIAEALAE